MKNHVINKRAADQGFTLKRAPLQLAALLLLSLLFSAAGASEQDPNKQAQALFEQLFEEQVALSPMWQTYLGRKTNYDLWDDISPEHEKRVRALQQDHLQRLAQLNLDALNDNNHLSYQVLDEQLRRGIDAHKWRDHSYPVNQMFGWHARIPSFLMNNHRIDDRADAEAYIARLQGVEPLVNQLIANLERRAKKQILAPNFVYPYVIADSKNIISGSPFDPDAQDSPLLEDFRNKLVALELSEKEHHKLLSAAKQALSSAVLPAYQKLIAYLHKLEDKADDRAGVWKLPSGEAYYEHMLQRMTTTELDAETIHKMGLTEVERIHGEMRALMSELEFEGDLQAFFTFMREDPQFYYPDTEAGRAAYLERTRELIAAMEPKLDDYFGRIPEAELIVRAVEPFREKSAGKAFYQGPAQDGSRPGIYYVNLHDMRALPKYQMEALTYHEALPGHHLQIALAQEQDDLPSFRRHSSYTAYSEGWGLYAEFLPKEMGFYRDPYSDFGRLSMALWRAVRLVVDTGIHHKKWTREQAIDYFVEQTPMTRADAVREIERYIVMPGQATAYQVGMHKILELRARAEQHLGEEFDLRAFHDLILSGGALPLTLLEQRVEFWIQQQTPQIPEG